MASIKSNAKLKGKRLDSNTWTQCMFWLEHKRRHCNMARVPGCDLCGVHVNQGTVGASKSHLNEERIACPLDPSHTVFKSLLKAHLKICNASKNKSELESQPYFSKNINSGKVSQKKEPSSSPSPATAAAATTNPNSNVNLPVNLPRLFDQIDELYKKYFPPIEHDSNNDGIELRFTEAEGCEEYLALSEASRESTKNRRSAYRHLLQQSSIVSTLLLRGLLKSSLCFVELGAGRAMLALAINAAVPTAPLILVERAAVRNKADRALRKKRKLEEHAISDTDSAVSSSFVRARVDIRDLKLSGLHLKGSVPIVGVAKHLCGVATDLGLRSLLTASTVSQGDDDWPGRLCESPQPRSLGVAGVCIATCCHHCCNWDDYVAKGFFMEELGLSSEQFKAMCKLSGWTCNQQESVREKPSKVDDEEDDDDEDHAVLAVESSVPRSLSTERRKDIGRKCKRLIDLGRLQFLKAMGFKTEIVHYCPASMSPENALLVAWSEG